MNAQPAILAPIPQHGRFLEFDLRQPDAAAALISTLAELEINDSLLVGLGAGLVGARGSVAGLKAFPDFENPNVSAPATQCDLLALVRGDEEASVSELSRTVESMLEASCSLQRSVDGFKYDTGRDLTGYEDGTENPTGQNAIDAAVVQDAADGVNGSSFMAIQQWLHDFAVFDSMTREQQDNAIGRHRDTNEEFDAPESSHVKRTAQEDFSPEAFVVRRSMPWSDDSGRGLMFVAFGKSFDAFEAQFNRMLGLDDGIVDALFQFSQPITGAYYWCPPVAADGRLDLSALG